MLSTLVAFILHNEPLQIQHRLYLPLLGPMHRSKQNSPFIVKSRFANHLRLHFPDPHRSQPYKPTIMKRDSILGTQGFPLLKSLIFEDEGLG
jgi:hypothetical protein